MADFIKPKRSTTPGSSPTVGQLLDGEMAVNIPDGRVFIRSGLGVYVVGEKNVKSDWASSSGATEILNKPTLGTAAAADTGDFATASQGALADTAVQPSDLSDVATSGDYNDLSNLPTLGTAAAADASDFVAKAGDTMPGSLELAGGVTILNDGNVFAFRGTNPTMQWQSNDQSQRIRMRAVLDDNSNDGWTLHKWNGSGWDQFLSADVTGLIINGNKTLTEQDTDSGTYTPTVVNVLNVASSSGGLCTYQRIGNSVDVAGSINITPTAAGTRTTVQITIPIPSDFSNNSNCGGSAAAARSDYTDIVPCYMQANASNDRLVLSFIPASLGSYSVSFATTYPIL